MSDETLDGIMRALQEPPKDHSLKSADPKDVAEFQADAIGDRRGTDWRTVMEAHGFTWYEPKALDITFGFQQFVPKELAPGIPNVDRIPLNRPHPEGEWRRPGMAFTVKDLYSYFWSPETFDQWIREEDRKKAMARSGLLG